MKSALIVLVACGSPAPQQEPPPPAELVVELASVQLADDCGETGHREPPQPIPPSADEVRWSKVKKEAVDKPDSAIMVRAGKFGPQRDRFQDQRVCEQTAMQLLIKTDGAAVVDVKKVELLEADGTPIGVLAARLPTKWTGSEYAAWDGTLDARSTAQVSFALGSPPWDKLGGRFSAQTKRYQVRVTLSIGGTSKTLEKTSIMPVQIEPVVVT